MGVWGLRWGARPLGWWRSWLGALGALVLLVTPVWGQTLGAPGAWQPGPGASGDNSYLGGIDPPGSGAAQASRLISISGWFVDTTAQGWAGVDRVQVYLGTMDSGTLLGGATLGISRPDLAGRIASAAWATAGWAAAIDPGSLSAGQNQLSVYAHTPDKGSWVAQVTVVVGAGGSVAAPAAAGGSGTPVAGATPRAGSTPAAVTGAAAASGVIPATGPIAGSGAFVAGSAPVITVAQPQEGDRVSDRNPDLRINGTVTDPTVGPGAIDWVELWLDGEQNSANAYFLGDADLATNGTWSLDFSPFNYPTIASNLYVYAHSDATGKTTLKVVHFEIVDRPL